MIKQSYWWLLITAVILLSIQILGVVIYVYSFIPYPVFWKNLFLKGVEPERETFFYGVFLTTCIVLMFLGSKWVLPRLGLAENLRKFKFWLCLEGVWCVLMVFCFFKWTTYRYPFWNVLAYENSKWLEPFFWGVCGVSALSKIFFLEIEEFYRKLQRMTGIESIPAIYVIFSILMGGAVVVLLLYIPHVQDVSALALVWDQWNHLDRVTGWFIQHGWYISYEQTIQMLIILGLVYLAGLFFLIRSWLNSWLLAAIGVMLTIKFGMFYDGCAPCIWINPSNSFLAHGWDIFLMLGLWIIASKNPKRFYWAAASTGVVLLMVWFKSGGYIEALGLDNQPLMAPLRVRQFFPFLMGYFVPLFYVFSLLLMMGQKRNQHEERGRAFAIVMSIYGLMIFVDYLEHPMIGFYGSLMVPAILLFLWWLNQLFSPSRLSQRRLTLGGILLISIGALMTNRLMLTYPNIIDQDPDRFTTERTYAQHFEVISASASLIDQLTREDQRVVLLSNFETALLMQAHREPVFDDFPVMFSSLSNGPGGLNLKTKKECLRLINNIIDENALYVFVDARILALSPQDIGNSGLAAVLGYLNNHYTVYTRRGFLVALQRK